MFEFVSLFGALGFGVLVVRVWGFMGGLLGFDGLRVLGRFGFRAAGVDGLTLYRPGRSGISGCTQCGYVLPPSVR